MKRIIAIASLMGSFQVFAWFSVSANCQVNRAKAVCVAWNHYGRPMYCKAKGRGMTYQGFWMKGFVDGWVNPGQNIWVEVYAKNPYQDPLVSANANVRCRF